MADVQLENGYVAIANRLQEAITSAPFSLTQLKVIHCVIRLTYGWNQLSAQIGLADVAERCGLAFSGGFRREFDALIRSGVLREIAPGHGRTPAEYALNKNFEEWGRYSVPSARLADLFRERPTSTRPPHMRQSTDTTPSSRVPPLSALTASVETKGCLSGGIQNLSMLRDCNNIDPPKAIESQEIQELTTTARELACAANLGLAEHPTRPQPIARVLPTSGTSHLAAVAITQAGVPLAFAKSQVFEIARTHHASGAVRSLGYFTDAVIQRWREHEAAHDAVHADRPAPAACRRDEVSGTDPEVWKRAAEEVEARDREAARRASANGSSPAIAACAVASVPRKR